MGIEQFAMISCFVVAISLALVTIIKINTLKRMHAENSGLKNSLNEMDEQAKLIVRTDLELNRTQEELDKKISGLYSLQKLSRVISTTLAENQIFKLISPESLKNLGFEKACVLIWDSRAKKFGLRLNIGCSENKTQDIEYFFNFKPDTYLRLIKNNQTASSISTAKDFDLKEKVKNFFGVHSFIVAPVEPKEGNKGFLLIGTESNATVITAGDEEIIAVLANQIGQALENARMFDKTWRAQQELERKVEERTRELKSALAEVEAVSRRKTEFISAVSHELRTPLTSIKGYASILLTGKLGKVPDNLRIRLEKINRHSDELTHLVNDLLDIARIESGRMEMKKEKQDIKNMVAGVADLLSAQLKDKQIEFLIQIPPDAQMALIDHSQINRVFINIIGNAIKFTPEKGKITVMASSSDDRIKVDITDSGCGIPEKAQEAIFEEFYRVDNTINQEVKGTGLGLPLVKHIIEAHKGKIWVSSKAGRGSTFSFTLPKKS